MNEVVLYLIKSLLTGALFFGFYQLAMRREPYFRLNRFYLISSALFIVVLPLLANLIPLDIFANRDQSRIALIILPEIVIKSTGIISPVQEQIYLNWGFMGYLVVTLAMLAGLMLSMIKIVRFYLTAKRAEKIDHNIYLYTGQGSPFSFLGRIYISRQYMDHPGLNSILIHENAHIRQYHIIDLLLMELLSSLFWFNPFFFLIKKALREVHEFLADREVINSGAEPINYQQLLFNEVSGNPQYIIANNFNLITKKRIIMLIKKSGKIAAVRIGIMMPVILAAAFLCASLQVNSLMAQNTKQSKQVTAQPSAKVTDQNLTPPLPPPPPPPPPPPQKKEKTVKVKDDSGKEAYTIVEVMPQFPGGEKARLKYMIGSVKYPEEAKNKGIEGVVYVSFIVEKDGMISNVKILRGIGGGCNEEALRVVKGMPKWLPGKAKGKPVRVIFNMPLKYALDKDKPKEGVK